MSGPIVAALYVETGGVYFNDPRVDPWDEARDARLYAGPLPVIAHPPCNRWSKPLAMVNETRYGHKVGDDGGCFEHALWAVREFGGVLEHPAHSAAWDRFQLPRPQFGCWAQSFDDPGMVSEVFQWSYGCKAEKKTWLYAHGVDPLPLKWTIAPHGLAVVSLLWGMKKIRESGREVIRHGEASATPPAFREALIALASGCPQAVAPEPALAVAPSSGLPVAVLPAEGEPGQDGGTP